MIRAGHMVWASPMSIKAWLPAEASKGEKSMFENKVAEVYLRPWITLMYVNCLCEDSANEKHRKQNYLEPSVPKSPTKLKQETLNFPGKWANKIHVRCSGYQESWFNKYKSIVHNCTPLHASWAPTNLKCTKTWTSVDGCWSNQSALKILYKINIQL